MAEPEWLTIPELAAWLRIPPATINAWRARGEGPPGTRVGRHVRFRRRAVEQWLAGRTAHISA